MRTFPLLRALGDHNVSVLDLAASLLVAPRRGDDIVLRLATPADVPSIVELTSAEIHPETTAEIWALAADPGSATFLVAEAAGSVVSSLAVIEGRLVLAGTELRYVQVEFVVTEPEYRRRRLVADLLAVVHRAAEAADTPVSIIGGLEYFYRQFGYGYAIDESRRHRLLDLPSGKDQRRACREAELSDIPALDALQASVHRHADLVVASTPERWNWLLRLDHERLVVAEKDGRIDAMARVYIDEAGIELSETAARSVPAADAVLAFVADQAPGLSVVVPDRPGGGSHFLDRSTEMVVERGAIYVRPTSLRILMNALTPVLDG